MRKQRHRACFSVSFCHSIQLIWDWRFLLLIGLVLSGLTGLWPALDAQAAGDEPVNTQIRTLEPDPRGGKAYRLIYDLSVDADIYWRFKTDFDNDLLVGNKFIKVHRVLSNQGRTVISENVYSYDPAHVFQWRTTVHHEPRRLEFQLLNADECGQIFHYGSIQIEAVAAGTRVTQTAFFDFWGVALWYHYPWSGGMREFLRYTAAWERQLTVQLEQRYPLPSLPLEQPAPAPSD